ncbi:MAG: glycosyltransferase family 4 protein, partial [Planctomycetota bacterium]
WFTNPKARLVVVEHHSNALKGVQDWTLTLINHWLAHATVYLTDQYRDQVKRKLKCFLFNKRVHVISNGLDLEVYKPLENRDFDNKDLVFGMQGRMTESKDYPTLFYAFAKFRESAAAGGKARLEIAGDGPMRAELEKLAKVLGIADAVDFLGMIPQEEMIGRLQNWDIFVLSTLGETMSRALMEAQACGVPLVASDVSGVSAAIDHGKTGMLVPAKDPDSLAATLVSLTEQPGVRREMAENSKRHAVESFSADQSWKRYREVVGKVLAEY